MQLALCVPAPGLSACEPCCQFLQCEEGLDQEGACSANSCASLLAGSPSTSSAGCSPRWGQSCATTTDMDYLEQLLVQEASSQLPGAPLSDHLADPSRLPLPGQVLCQREATLQRATLVNWLTELAFNLGASSDALFLAVAAMDRCTCSAACAATRAPCLPFAADTLAGALCRGNPSSTKLQVEHSLGAMPAVPPNAHPLLQQYHRAAALQQQQRLAEQQHRDVLPVGPCGCLAAALLHHRWSGLVAAACLWVAMKYEDNSAPPASAFLAAGRLPFTPDQLMDAEGAVLRALDYRLASLPTAKTFLRRLAAVAPLGTELYLLASYLAETCLLEWHLTEQPGSVVAAASVMTAARLLSAGGPLPSWLGVPELMAYHPHQLEEVGQVQLSLYVHLAAAARCGNPYASTAKYLQEGTYPAGSVPLPLRVPPGLVVGQEGAPMLGPSAAAPPPQLQPPPLAAGAVACELAAQQVPVVVPGCGLGMQQQQQQAPKVLEADAMVLDYGMCY